MAYPINKGTVYVGPITLWMAVSMTLWFLFSVMSVLTSIWVYFRHPGERRQAWYSFVAGQCVFMLSLAGCGTAINRVIEGQWPSTLYELVYVIVFVAGLVISLRGLWRK
jgi:ABC-type transport system involved in multi-copper enzyme maturation permease subunit